MTVIVYVFDSGYAEFVESAPFVSNRIRQKWVAALCPVDSVASLALSI